MPPRKPRKWVRTHNSHLATKFPKPVRCGRCGETVLLGMVAGLDSRFDLTPLSPVGELEAIKLGRRTYYLVPAIQAFGERTPSVIRNELRPKLNGVVIRDHVCWTPRSQYTEMPRRREDVETEDCPF